MTSLKSYLEENGTDKTKEKLAGMDSSLLFAELDDTIQLDLLGLDNVSWAKKDKLVYNLIIAELKNRLN